MLLVAGFQGDVAVGFLGRQLGEQPVVADVDDVAAQTADDGGYPSQRAGHVLQFDPQLGDAAVADQCAHQERGQQPAVDIAAGEDDAHLLAAKHLGVGEDGGQPRRAGPFGYRLFNGQEQRDGAFQAVFADQHHLVHQPAADL